MLRANAWLINLANPSGMLSEAVNQHCNINFAGLCNGPTVARTSMVKALNAEPRDVFCKIIGLNHLIWMKVYFKGEDVTENGDG
jgi:6-phospho-beta-glucosidase